MNLFTIGVCWLLQQWLTEQLRLRLTKRTHPFGEKRSVHRHYRNPLVSFPRTRERDHDSISAFVYNRGGVQIWIDPLVSFPRTGERAGYFSVTLARTGVILHSSNLEHKGFRPIWFKTIYTCPLHLPFTLSHWCTSAIHSWDSSAYFLLSWLNTPHKIPSNHHRHTYLEWQE